MAYWLFKSEPEEFPFHELAQSDGTTWNGVRNPFALASIRRMRTGDLAFFYHTGKEKRIVGVVKIVSDPYIEADTGCPVIDIAPVRALPVPVTLAQLKQDPFFAAWHLVRIPRLSVMSVPPDIWERVMAFTGTEGMDL